MHPGLRVFVGVDDWYYHRLRVVFMEVAGRPYQRQRVTVFRGRENRRQEIQNRLLTSIGVNELEGWPNNWGQVRADA